MIIDGDYADRHIFKRHNLEQEQRFPFLKGDLETCGLSLKTLSELEDRLDELVGVTLEVSQQTVRRRPVPGLIYSNFIDNDQNMLNTYKQRFCSNIKGFRRSREHVFCHTALHKVRDTGSYSTDPECECPGVHSCAG